MESGWGVVAGEDFAGIVVIYLDALQASGVDVGEVGNFVVERGHVLAVGYDTAVANLVRVTAVSGVPKCPRLLHFGKSKRGVVDYQGGFVGFSANYRPLYKGFKLCKAVLQNLVEGIYISIKVVDDFGFDGLFCPKYSTAAKKGLCIYFMRWNKMQNIG